MKLKSKTGKRKNITWDIVSFVNLKSSFTKNEKPVLKERHVTGRKLPRRLTFDEKIYLYSVRPDLDLLGIMEFSRHSQKLKRYSIYNQTGLNNPNPNNVKTAINRFFDSLALLSAQEKHFDNRSKDIKTRPTPCFVEEKNKISEHSV